MNPLIKCYGVAPQHFATYVAIDNVVNSIKKGDGAYTIDSRKDCYVVPRQLHKMVQTIAEYMEINIDVFDDCEIFAPSQDYPSHIDEHGQSLAIPLEDHCTINVDGFCLSTEKTGIYMFDDTLPHRTSGIFLMISVSE